MQERRDAVSGFRMGRVRDVESRVYSGRGEMSRILGVAKGDETVAQRHGSNGKSAVRAPEMVAESKATAESAGLSREQLIEFYRLMYLSRRTDDREIQLKKQQKIFFQISCAGHEALLVAAGIGAEAGI